MRPFFAIAALIAVGLGLAGWATLGQAQPRGGSRPPVLPDPFKPDRPAKAASPKPVPRPAEDDPDGRLPVIRSGNPEVSPAPGPVRVIEPIDSRDIGLPSAPVPPVKPAGGKESPSGGVK